MADPSRAGAPESGARALAKRLAFLAASLMVAPALLSYRIRGRLLGPDRALLGSTQALGLVPGVLGHYLRRAFLYRALESFHPSATVEFGTLFSQRGARVGADVYIGPMCHIGLAEIGRDTLLAAGVHVPSGPAAHGTGALDRPIREQPGALRRVTVGAGCWVGSGAVLLADVGAETVVAAGAVVTRPLPERVVAAGVPARVVKQRAEGAEAASRDEQERVD